MSLKRNILSYTGTLDVLSYKNEEDENKEVYLWYKKQKKSDVTKAIPVPKYYWKLVYDEKENKGVAFVGLNDPHSKDLKEEDYLCKPNICEQIGWFMENVKDTDVEKKGHISCCSIEDFAKVVPNVDKFKTDQGKYITQQSPSLITCDLTCKFKCQDQIKCCKDNCEECTCDECNLCELIAAG